MNTAALQDAVLLLSLLVSTAAAAAVLVKPASVRARLAVVAGNFLLTSFGVVILMARYAPSHPEFLLAGAVLPIVPVLALRATANRYALIATATTLVSLGWLWAQRLALASTPDGGLKASLLVVAAVLLLGLVSRRRVAEAAAGVPGWLLLGLALIGFSAPLVARYATHGAFIGVTLAEGLSFQPSEFARILMVIWLAGRIDQHRHLLHVGTASFPVHTNTPARVAARLSLPAMVGVVMGVVSNDFGPALLLAMVTVVMLMVAGMQRRYLLAATALALVAINAAQLISTKVQARISQLDDPLRHGEGLSQVGLGLAALSRGGWLGLGLGQGLPAKVPRGGDDMLLVTLSEELGGLTVCCVLVLIAISFAASVRLAKASGAGAPHLVIAGLASLQLIQSAWAAGGNFAVVPLTGIPIPLLAISGSSLMSSMLSVGLRLGLAGQGDAPDTAPAIAERLRALTIVGTAVMALVLAGFARWEFTADATLAAATTARVTQLSAVNRGTMVTSDGVTVATTTTKPNSTGILRPENAVRVYPAGPAYDPVLGSASSNGYRSGLEAGLDRDLRCQDPDRLLPGGCPTVSLTLDSRVQSSAYAALEGRSGAIVITEVATGNILAYVSRDAAAQPGPASADHVRVETAMPGSSAKLITAAAALQTKGLAEPSPLATYKVAGQTFTGHNGAVCGTSLDKAIAESCNPYFAQLGVSLGDERLNAFAASLLNAQTTVSGMPIATSTLTGRATDEAMTALGSVGLGNAQVTPMAMSAIATTIARDGQAVCLRLTPRGTGDCSAGSMPATVAQRLQRAMTSVVTKGTAKGISSLKGYAGKTGTADRGNGLQDAWFVGYAPANDPQVAITVFVLPTADHPLPQGAGDAGNIAGAVLQAALQVRD